MKWQNLWLYGASLCPSRRLEKFWIPILKPSTTFGRCHRSPSKYENSAIGFELPLAQAKNPEVLWSYAHNDANHLTQMRNCEIKEGVGFS